MLRLLLLVVVGVVRLLLCIWLLRLCCILGPLLGIGLPILHTDQLMFTTRTQSVLIACLCSQPMHTSTAAAWCSHMGPFPDLLCEGFMWQNDAGI